MRAVTITVSEKSGVAGFVFPGDHVDLMLTTSVKVTQTQTPPGGVTDNRDLYATETILKNLRVLATDQSTDQETNNGKTIVHTFHTATLEVTPRSPKRSRWRSRAVRSAWCCARWQTIRAIWITPSPTVRSS
jgi:pilus assembly protein CpaB